MTLASRLARLEQQGRPPEAPFRFLLTVDGITRDTLTGQSWPAAEYRRLHPETRTFTFNIAHARADAQVLTDREEPRP